MNRNQFDNGDQFTLSLEVLHLMQWLIEHDQEGLKKLINRALAHGLHDKLHTPLDSQQSKADAQHSIIDFFVLLETLLLEATNEQSTKNIVRRNIIPAVNRIDTDACDNHTVITSLEQATAQLSQQPEENPQELFVKELIKRWKPNKKAVVLN